MQFGKHQPQETRDRSTQSAMATFARGIQSPGTQWEFKFDNGFGASVINDGYGADQGLYEVAVMGPGGDITYETPITDDVLGYLTAEDVAAALDRIEALTAADVEAEVIRRANLERDRRIEELRAELASLEAGESA